MLNGEEEQTLVDVVNSNITTSKPKVSIADIHYEILNSRSSVQYFKNDVEKKVEIEGSNNMHPLNSLKELTIRY